MATDCIAQVTFNFDPKRKPVVAAFDMPHASSDGGAILLKGIDTQFGLTKRVAACLDDLRQPGKVQHQTLELLRQRVFGLACGYADCNDAARLADDAIHKLRERTGTVYERQAARGALDKMRLISFHSPADIKGSGVLTIEHSDRKNDRWLYLPAYHTTRRISPANRGDRYMSTGARTLFHGTIPEAWTVRCKARGESAFPSRCERAGRHSRPFTGCRE